MVNKVRFICISLLMIGFLLFAPRPSSAQERLCDPSFEFCYWPIIDSVNAETVGIDVALYMIELPGLADAIIARHRAGVQVRIVVEPRANVKFPGNQALLDRFRAAGIPMRYKVGDGILHSKIMLFAGQNKVLFSGSNFGDADVGPYEAYSNYVDGVWYFSDDPAVVNSCKTRLDDIWTNTALYGDYANITGPLTRKYPTHPIDPSMNFVPNSNPLEDYGRRAIAQIDQESQKIDITMYRITDTGITDAILRAVGRGVQVRLLAEPLEYRFGASRFSAELTDPYNVDRLFMAGVQIKMRKHRGLNHQKSVQLYSQGMTIFGSSNWGIQSYNSEEDHNYFTTKPWFFQWFVNQFDRKWNSAVEYEPFVPQPPDAPVNLGPANGGAGQSTSLALSWEGGPWAHKYDIYLGSDSNNLSLIASDVITGTPGPSGSESYTVSGLRPGTAYYWRIVGKTMANQTASGPTWVFSTAGTPPPAQAPTVSSISPNSGTINGGTPVTITGTNFAAGLTVAFGGAAATNVNVSNSTTITAVSPGHAAGGVNIVVTNPGGQSGTLVSGFTYTNPPPQAPTVSGISPGSGSTLGGTSVTITGTNFSPGATVTIGGTTATSVNVVSGTSITATTPAHSAGAVNVVVTNTSGQSGTLNAGYTYTSPPPPSAPDVVLYASEAPVKAGSWTVTPDSSAAGGARLLNPDSGAAKLPSPLASPSSYFEMTFNAQAGVPYRLWIRGKAQSDFYGNDSVFVQFSGSVTSSGAATFRIGTTSATEYNLEDCSGCGLSGWGWQDNGWGVGVLGPVIYFA
ncbi:MAG TPA: IPT/TIG domain-containing protein, partial [Blastocatellia bacterium]|nr:IPT/TIG domain-containing protein [Blastocatellia bacterium]